MRSWLRLVLANDQMLKTMCTDRCSTFSLHHRSSVSVTVGSAATATVGIIGLAMNHATD